MPAHNVIREINDAPSSAADFKAAGIKADVIAESTSATGVTIDGVKLKDSEVTTDTINEKTSATGVTIDGVVAKDSGVTITGLIRTGVERQVGTRAKVGTTAGWTVAAANNLPYMGTVAASQTGSTLVASIDGLHVGDTITAFKVVAQIESAGGAVTLDADLRAITNAAGEPTDASIGAITQVSVTADTAVAAAKTALTQVVAANKSYYVLLTATTAASTDIILIGLTVTVTES